MVHKVKGIKIMQLKKCVSMCIYIWHFPGGKKKNRKEENNPCVPCFFLIIRGRLIDLNSGNQSIPTLVLVLERYQGGGTVPPRCTGVATLASFRRKNKHVNANTAPFSSCVPHFFHSTLLPCGHMTQRRREQPSEGDTWCSLELFYRSK